MKKFIKRHVTIAIYIFFYKEDNYASQIWLKSFILLAFVKLFGCKCSFENQKFEEKFFL